VAPGASMSMIWALFVKDDMPSVFVVEPTGVAFVRQAGEDTPFVYPLLPVAITTEIF